jgi:ATP/maltotriose-dependent transcriptional regulator MalT
LHRAIAEALRAHPELSGADASIAAELAHHWYLAGDMPAALAASINAAAQAERMHAHHEALRHLDRALELWDRVAVAEELAGLPRADVLIRASEMAERSGDAERAVELAYRARRALDQRADPLRAAAAESRLGNALWNAGRADDALEHLAQVVQLVPEAPPSVARAEALAAFGRVLMLNGAFGRARGHLEQALTLARSLAARIVESSVLASLAIVYTQFGERREAIAAGREGLRIANELDAGGELLRAYINGSQAIDDDGRLEEAIALGLQGIEAAHRHGLDRADGDHLRMQTAWRLIRVGRLDEAERVVRPAFENATLAFNIAATKNIAGYFAAARGEFDRAEELLERAWELMQHSGGFQLIGLALSWRASLYLWRGELDRAREVAQEGLRRASVAEGQLIYTAEAFWLAARVEADRAIQAAARGRRAEAAHAAGAAADVAAALALAITGYHGDGPPPEAIAFDALALAEVTRARESRGLEPWQAAAEYFRALHEPYPEAYAEYRIAETLALAGAAPRDVAERLRRAHEIAIAVGVQPFREQVEELARRARVPLRERPGRDLSVLEELGLTEREADVLALLAEGRTNRQIGEELFISVKTASVHVSRILMKLGVANRAEAAAAAHRLGLARVVRS